MAGGISRSQVTVAVNNDKTGYSLTAGSYVLHATNNQRATITLNSVTSNTATISSVTVTRTRLAFLGQKTAASTAALDTASAYLTLTSATVVTATSQGASTNNVVVSFEVEETY